MAQDVVRPPKADEVLKTLDRTHPRLMLKETGLSELKKRIGTDALLKASVDALLRNADAISRKPPLVYKKIGPRLLQVSRDCVNRMYTLGLAWRLTGDVKYVDAAKGNLLAVCAFDDWNPSHFLDTAEMSHAVGIGYDWFYVALDDATRAKVRKGLVKNGLVPGAAAYGPGKSRMWWVTSDFNWNQVCNGGLIVGALAIAETDPEWAEKIVPPAVASLPKAVASYAPDGAWGEGPGYWDYATMYTAYALAGLESALGTDYGLGKIKGLSEAGWFPILTAGPTGLFFNFADAGENERRRNSPCLFYLASRYAGPAFAEAEREMMGKRPGEPLDIIWYVPGGRGNLPAPPLDKRFRGDVEVVTMRSTCDSADALFVGVKAGYNHVNHGHLDLGTFVVDALGVRWACDLGRDDYNLPGYWDGSRATDQRWTYYRLNSLSHNVALLDGRSQNVDAKTKFDTFKSTPGFACAVVELTSAYLPEAKSVKRGLAMIDRRSVLIQDEFELVKPCEIAWGMTTGAAIVLAGNRAVLREGEKEMDVAVVSPKGATFSVESAERQPPDHENKGIRRLMIRLAEQQGSVRVVVWMGPRAGAEPGKPPAIKPLAEW